MMKLTTTISCSLTVLGAIGIAVFASGCSDVGGNAQSEQHDNDGHLHRDGDGHDEGGGDGHDHDGHDKDETGPHEGDSDSGDHKD